MGPLTHPHFAANGNVSPCRFITPVVGTVGGLAVQASDATKLIIGVSFEGTRNPPNSPSDDGYVAIANEPLPYYGPGEICNVTVGAVALTNANVLLTTDSNGKAIIVDDTSDAKICVGALSLQAGAAGDKIMCYVLSPFYQMSVHA